MAKAADANNAIMSTYGFKSEVGQISIRTKYAKKLIILSVFLEFK